MTSCFEAEWGVISIGYFAGMFVFVYNQSNCEIIDQTETELFISITLICQLAKQPANQPANS